MSIKSQAVIKVTVDENDTIEIITEYSPTLDQLKTETQQPLPISHIIVNDIYQQLNAMGDAQPESTQKVDKTAPEIIIP